MTTMTANNNNSLWDLCVLFVSCIPFLLLILLCFVLHMNECDGFWWVFCCCCFRCFSFTLFHSVVSNSFRICDFLILLALRLACYLMCIYFQANVVKWIIHWIFHRNQNKYTKQTHTNNCVFLFCLYGISIIFSVHWFVSWSVTKRKLSKFHFVYHHQTHSIKITDALQIVLLLLVFYVWFFSLVLHSFAVNKSILVFRVSLYGISFISYLFYIPSLDKNTFTMIEQHGNINKKKQKFLNKYWMKFSVHNGWNYKERQWWPHTEKDEIFCIRSVSLNVYACEAFIKKRWI